MKKMMIFLLCLILLSSSNTVFAVAKKSEMTNVPLDGKAVLEYLCLQQNEYSRSVDQAKEVVEEYLRINMKKYDPAARGQLSYDHVIRSDNPFKEYAEKQMVLINNRYRSFDSLSLERVNFKINYGEISYNKGLITVHVSVHEEKKYTNQKDCGYVRTNHVITLEQINGRFYVKNDVTDDYVDTYLREYADKDKCTIDELIENDEGLIREALNKSKEEMDIYLQIKENNLIDGLEINQVDTFLVETEKTSSVFNDTEGENFPSDEYKKIADSRGVKVYSFNYGAMLSYAARYNGACVTSVQPRNPAYENFDHLGGDCTNYVSQIIHAGGAPMDDTGSYQWYYYDSYHRCCWTTVGDLYDYLIHNDYIGPQGADITNAGSFYAAGRGDLIQLKFSGSSYYVHSLWIISHEIGTTSCTRIACHTSDRWNEPLDGMPGYKRWIKLKGYGQ